MKKTAVLFLISIFVVFFDTCGTFAQEINLPPDREYIIGVNDSLNIETGERQYARKVVVRPDGKITLPDLGDIHAAGLPISVFKANLEKLLKRYLRQPRVTITVGFSKTIRVILTGVLSREVEVPRGTTLLQVLREIYPQLQRIQPAPLITEMIVKGGDKEFPINGQDLVFGQAPDMNIRLEWGDNIYIPPRELPTPAPTEVPKVTLPKISKRATMSTEQFELLVQQFPESEELLRTLATQPEENLYSIEISTITEAQQQKLGEEILAALEKYTVEQREEIPHFADIVLAGINIYLAYEPPLEAFLAIPNSEDSTQLPRIKRFREGDRVEKGETEAEDIFLEKIQDTENMVVLRQRDKFQPLFLPESLSNAKLSGIMNLGGTKKAFFSDLETSKSKQISKRRGFQEGDEIENGVMVATISDNWVLLKKEQNIQLVFLRDSLHRASSTAPSASETEQAMPPFETVDKDQSIMPTGIMKQLLPDKLQALNTFSKIFFATPIF